MSQVGQEPPATNASRATTVTDDTRTTAYVGAYLGHIRIVPVAKTQLIDVYF